MIDGSLLQQGIVSYKSTSRGVLLLAVKCASDFTAQSQELCRGTESFLDSISLDYPFEQDKNTELQIIKESSDIEYSHLISRAGAIYWSTSLLQLAQDVKEYSKETVVKPDLKLSQFPALHKRTYTQSYTRRQPRSRAS